MPFDFPGAVLFALIAFMTLIVGGGSLSVWLVERRRHRGQVTLTASLPVNSKWWNDQRRAEGTLLYVAMGDSAAQGIGASRPGRSYVGLIARQLQSTFGHRVRVVNLSQSGARLREALSRQVPQLRALQPDVLTVSVGANDMSDFDADRFALEFGELCDALPPQALVADLPSFHLGKRERNVRIANSIVRKAVAEHSLTLVPLHAATKRRGASRTALRDVSVDFFHPNDRGYQLWASAFLPLLPKAIENVPEHWLRAIPVLSDAAVRLTSWPVRAAVTDAPNAAGQHPSGLAGAPNARPGARSSTSWTRPPPSGR